ncbi:hypothetical protein GIB67_017686 [Kingdonia uniflora]|uniref:Aminotransferase-like plant mobile domain-containing protein n=1 Tax=Kingdonia uniflora TaxID=39325 RepID=A0A7J7NAT1_9MAGN|nr:hypothetical protein GIB67_017686 [Kingdonia uniflora]
MQMLEGEPHPSTLPEFRRRRDPERSVTHSRSGRKKKRVKFEDVQPQDIPNPTDDNFSRRYITQLPDGVSHIYYTGKELTNRDSMRVHGTFTTVFKVWKDITTLPAVRDAVVNIFGQFMDIRLGNSDNRLIQALTERWQLLPNIDSSHIKSGNVSIAHLKTYLTVEIHREDDITIARTFILFMMGHLWFQIANDTVPLGYLAAVNDLDLAAQYAWGYVILTSLYHGLDTAVTTGGAITGFVQLLLYWFYEYCGVGHPIVKEEIKYATYPYLRAWERGNRKKTNDQAANLFIIGRYHIDHRTVKTITWEPWFDSAVSETEDVTGEVRIPLDPSLSMSPHISPATLHEMRQAEFIDWRRENLPIARLRDLPPMSSSYGTKELRHLTHGMRRLIHAESLWDAQRIQKVEEELAIAHRKIDSIDHQLYAHLRKGRDVRVVPLPPGEGARTRQRGSGLRTRGGSTSCKGRGTGDDFE